MEEDVQISNEPKENENFQNQTGPVKPKKKKFMKCIVLALIIIAVVAGILLMYPRFCISDINNNYDSQQYAKVAKYNSQLDMLKNNLKNDSKTYVEIQYKVKLSQSLVLFENKEFEKALNSLLEISSPDETINNKINDCKYELGKISLDAEKYDKALEYLQEVTNKDDLNDLLDKAYSNIALKYLEEADYSKALSSIEKVTNKSTDEFNNINKQVHYEYGKYSLGKNDYDNAISHLQQAQGYQDSNTLINNANMGKAEYFVKLGNLQQAKSIYDTLPDELEYNGIKAANRKNQLNKFAGLIAVTGKKYATKCYSESRNVWNYDGRWDNWYIDTPSPAEYIETSLILNDDGTTTLKGTAYFYAFNNFSSLSEYCNAKLTSRTFEMKNIQSIPSSYTIDEHTKLSYSNGKFTIKYHKRDDYSINFHNIYASTVTY